MNKLIVFTLVFGMASSANALISLSYNGSPAPAEVTILVNDTSVIDVTTDDTLARVDYLQVFDYGAGTFSLAGAVAGPALGDMGSIIGPYDANPFGLDALETEILMGWSPESTPVTGTTFEITLQCEDVGDVVVDLVDENFALIDTLTIYQIPEPMSVALLGLGGLFLRRRR